MSRTEGQIEEFPKCFILKNENKSLNNIFSNSTMSSLQGLFTFSLLPTVLRGHYFELNEHLSSLCFAQFDPNMFLIRSLRMKLWLPDHR